MSKYIDTHAHLYLEPFSSDIDEVTRRAGDAGVQMILLPNIDQTSVLPMRELSKKYPAIYRVMTGLHPTSVKENWREELDSVFHALQDENPVAVGETGIDLYWDKTFIEEQKQAFEVQIDYAKQHSLPLVIHSRNSLDLIIDILKPHKGSVTGVFHCFPGSVQQAKKVADMGFLLGIGGVATYKNAKMADVAAYLPSETLLLETDAPFLTPQQERGKRNESAFIPLIAGFIAARRNISTEMLAEITTSNAEKLFGLKK